MPNPPPKFAVNPEALELATRLASIEQEQAGLSFAEGSALRFLFWGVEPFVQAIVLLSVPIVVL